MIIVPSSSVQDIGSSSNRILELPPIKIEQEPDKPKCGPAEDDKSRASFVNEEDELNETGSCAANLDYTMNDDGSCVCKLCGELLPSRTHWYRHKYKVREFITQKFQNITLRFLKVQLFRDKLTFCKKKFNDSSLYCFISLLFFRFTTCHYIDVRNVKYFSNLRKAMKATCKIAILPN